MTASRQIHSVQSLVVGWGQRCGLKAEVIVDLFYFRDWSLITQIGVGGGRATTRDGGVASFTPRKRRGWTKFWPC